MLGLNIHVHSLLTNVTNQYSKNANVYLIGTSISGMTVEGTMIGYISVTGGVGNYIATLTENPNSSFYIENNIIYTTGTITNGIYPITIQIDNGIDPPSTKSFVITSTNAGVDPTLPVGYILTKQDTFTTLDYSFWSPRYSAAEAILGNVPQGTPVGDTTFALDPNHTFTVGANANPFSISPTGQGLVITAKRTSTVGFQPNEIPTNPQSKEVYPYVSGHLEAATWSQTQGYFEWTLESVTYDKSSWPAGWALPRTRTNTNAWEMDAFELAGTAVGSGPNIATQALHTANGYTYEYFPNIGSNPYSTSHIYAVLWTDTYVHLMIDGSVKQSIDVTDMPQATDPQYPLIDFNVGSLISSWVPNIDSTTPNSLQMKLSRFRAAQKPGPQSVVLSNSVYIDNATVGTTIATLSTNLFQTTGQTYTILDDPDGMFQISGQQLQIKTVVLASVKNTHDVRIQVEDDNGNKCQRLFTIEVLPETPVQFNYVVAPNDITNTFWVLNNVTAVDSSTALETVTNGQHNIYAMGVPRTAAIKTFTFWIEVQPIGRSVLKLQLFDDYFGSNQIFIIFDLSTNTFNSQTAYGAWTFNSARMTPIFGSTKVRCEVSFTTDAASSLLTFSPQIAQSDTISSYPGDIGKGMKFSNICCFNSAAGANGA